jgi:hypothetical protein
VNESVLPKLTQEDLKEIGDIPRADSAEAAGAFRSWRLGKGRLSAKGAINGLAKGNARHSKHNPENRLRA